MALNSNLLENPMVYVRRCIGRGHGLQPTGKRNWASRYHEDQQCPALRSAVTRNDRSQINTETLSRRDARKKGWKHCRRCVHS
jgi:hypothetical protein